MQSEPRRPRTALEGDIEVDVAVVGAGLEGPATTPVSIDDDQER
jgi:hypothetical protein